MDDNDKKRSTLETVIDNLSTLKPGPSTASSGTSDDLPPGTFAAGTYADGNNNLVNHISTLNPGSNIREVDFKKNSDDIVQTLGAETDAILITYDKHAGELKLYHNGVEIDKAVFAKVLKAETSYYALFDYVQEKFKSWRDAWVN